jgi:hypothetical protein
MPAMNKVLADIATALFLVILAASVGASTLVMLAVFFH